MRRAASAGLAVAGASVIAVGVLGHHGPPQPGRSVAGVAEQGKGAIHAATLPLPSAAPPTALDIPAIGASSSVVPLDLNADGSVQVPSDYAQVGWYDRSSLAGAAGPTVLLGHVDSRSGPAVFFRLGALRPGDLVVVTRHDGRRLTYRITGVRSYPKDAFPTVDVYGPTVEPALRLITCGGDFDEQRGHYLDNIVAFGQLVGQP